MKREQKQIWRLILQVLSTPGHRKKRMQTARATAAGKQIKGHPPGKMIPNNLIIWTVERRKRGFSCSDSQAPFDLFFYKVK